jgi:hypothetical protein
MSKVRVGNTIHDQFGYPVSVGQCGNQAIYEGYLKKNPLIFPHLQEILTHTHSILSREGGWLAAGHGGDRRRAGGGTAALRRPATADGGVSNGGHLREALDEVINFSFFAGKRIGTEIGEKGGQRSRKP